MEDKEEILIDKEQEEEKKQPLTIQVSDSIGSTESIS